MKLIPIRILQATLLGTLTSASAAVFTSDTSIGAINTGYDGQTIIVSNGTLTVDGPHTFAELRVATGATLTHGATSGGIITIFASATNESQTLTDANAAALANTNVNTASVVVRDLTGTVTYSNSIDYAIGSSNAFTTIQRTVASAIGSGSTVLVSYDYAVGATNAGLTLTVNGNLEVEPGAMISADGRGRGGNLGPGNGGETGSPLSGGGAGYGGYGGVSSSNASGGTAYGSYMQPNDLGSGGGAGYAGAGGAGGGAIQLVVMGSVTNNGIISANGAGGTNSRSGGGSGGSIWITATHFGGSGAFSANGGTGEPIHGGGGGGGRIALEYGGNSFTGAITAYGGNGAQRGGAGTVYTSNIGPPGTLMVDNGGVTGASTPLQVTNSAGVTIRGRGIAIVSTTQTLRTLLVKSDGTLMEAAYPLLSFPLTVTLNATIESGGALIADNIGYPPNIGAGLGRYSQLGTTNFGGGGGHAGYGALGGYVNSYGGITYDSTTAPSIAGSGGGGSAIYQTNVAGSGGGVIRLIVNGALTVDGKISANGGNAAPNGGGGGAGGSVYLTAGIFAGTGLISANGGAGNSATSGGGGGGRIAIEYTSSVFAGVTSASGGSGFGRGGAGTIYTKPSQSPGVVVMDNGSNIGTNTTISVSGIDVTLRNGATFSSPGTSIRNLLVQSNGWLFPAGYPSSASTFTITGDATIDPGGGVVGDGLGYQSISGGGIGLGGSQLVTTYPTTTYFGGGGGHGGYGASAGHANDRGGNSYGSATAPTTLGSSGGGSGSSFAPFGGSGGGAFRLNVTGKLTVNGRVSADGTSGSGQNAGGGAGGSVWLTVGTLAGSGLISASGGAGTFGGGGGGGRVAVTFNTNLFSGVMAAYGGGGTNRGGAGTIYTKTNSSNSSQILISNNGQSGTNTPIGGITADFTIKGNAIAVISTATTIANLLVMTNSSVALTQALTVTGNATIQNGGAISADGGGFTGGLGTGAGSTSGGIRGGGGHGGFGAGNANTGGGAYGSLTSPTTSGSGGGNGSGTFLVPFGGSGGGAARLTVNGTLTVDGKLSSDGRDGDLNSGGGAGGSVWLTLNTLTGHGIISANGGTGNGLGAGGGGGRISISYGSNLFAGSILATGGGGYSRGGAGTIYLKPNLAGAGQVLVDNGGGVGTNTPLSSTYSLPTSAFNLTVSGGALVYPQSAFPLFSNVTVNSGGAITLLAGQSSLVLGVLGDLNIGSGSAITVDGKGYTRAAGPGFGGSVASKGAGGGYGGNGGASASGAAGGTNYGSAAQPVDRGSGGGAGANAYSSGCEGGSAVRLSVGGKLTVDGSLTASGNAGLQDDSGGGAGGSLWVSASQLIGSGNILAAGGSGDLYGGGGGGGGRIAIYSPANTFTSLVSVAGGAGATPGQTGTVFSAASQLGFQALSHSPTGVVSNTLSFIDITFSDAINPNSVTASDFILYTPVGQVAQANLTTSFPSLTTLRLTFPQQNFVGNYRVEAGPGILDLFGQPMSQVYTGAFSIQLPAISGMITNTNGLAVAGVSVQPSGGLQAAISDGTGAYAFGVPAGWSGTVTPSFSGSMFVPGARSYSNVQSDSTRQDFLLVSTIGASLTGGSAGTNFGLGWYGIANVVYQPAWSTNLIDWYPLASPITGTNGLLQLLVPVATDPVKFFRVSAQN
jgi:hypothetical protein